MKTPGSLDPRKSPIIIIIIINTAISLLFQYIPSILAEQAHGAWCVGKCADNR